MKRFTAEELAAMHRELQQIEDTSESYLQLAERSYNTVQEYLQRLKSFIQAYGFEDSQEEISFFKEVKPKFLKELIYFKEAFYLEANTPPGDTSNICAYYRQAIRRIAVFFERNHRFYIYYKTGKTDRDEQYFTDSNPQENLLTEYLLDMDRKFSNPYSFKLSKIQALERLNDRINYQLRLLEAPAETGVSELTLPWTDKKSGLIEILYGIQSMGCLNHAKAELKQIARLFEAAFKIDLGNYSRAFQEIRIRKKGRTPFLDRMKEMLIKRMDEADEYF
ncbi:MAG: RteC domain-containing protein [Bacteroidetes bacterium]|nr:RteC domain-containing protein [Bacteroidota bacterium]